MVDTAGRCAAGAPARFDDYGTGRPAGEHCGRGGASAPEMRFAVCWAHFATALRSPMSIEHQQSPYKSKGGLRRILSACRYSMQGLMAALKYESAFRQEVALAVILVPAAFWLGRSLVEVALLLTTILLVLVAELLNSAVEALADALSVDTHPLLGRAKDLGSAAVMLALLFSGGLWLTLLVLRFCN